MMQRCKTIMLLGGLLACAGCSQTYTNPLMPVGTAKRWPPAPASAKVRLLGQIASSDDIAPPSDGKRFWTELVHGPMEASTFATPHAVAVHEDGQRVAVADTNRRCVHVFNVDARKYSVIEKTEKGGPDLKNPVGVAWVGDRLWIADAEAGACVVVDVSPAGVSGSGRAVGKGKLKKPVALAYLRANDLCYVVDAGAHAIVAFDSSGAFRFQFGTRGGGPGQFNYPSHVSVRSDGMIAVSDSLNFRVQLFKADGTPVGGFGQKGDSSGDFALPKGVAWDAGGNLWVADAHFENVQAFSQQGELLMTLGQEGQKPGEFWLPAGLFIDTQGRLWVADTYNRRVQVFQLLS